MLVLELVVYIFLGDTLDLSEKNLYFMGDNPLNFPYEK